MCTVQHAYVGVGFYMAAQHLARYKLPKNREGIATLGHTGRFDRAKFEGDKFEKESIIIIIHRKITDKFAGERLGREKFHGWNCQAYQNPPTPAFAKAGAAPGTTAGVELVFLGFKRLSDSWQLRSACRLPLLLERCPHAFKFKSCSLPFASIALCCSIVAAWFASIALCLLFERCSVPFASIALCC